MTSLSRSVGALVRISGRSRRHQVFTTTDTRLRISTGDIAKTICSHSKHNGIKCLSSPDSRLDRGFRNGLGAFSKTSAWSSSSSRSSSSSYSSSCQHSSGLCLTTLPLATPPPSRFASASASSASTVSNSDTQSLDVSNSKTDAKIFSADNKKMVDGGSALVLQSGDQTRHLPVVWLRDHCRCPSCYNHKTLQKEKVLNPLVEEGLTAVTVSLQDTGRNGSTLLIQWKDGHLSPYPVDWLMANSYHPESKVKVERFLWDAAKMEANGLPRVPFQSHVETEEGLHDTLHKLVQYGFVLVDEAPASMEGTEAVTSRVAPVQNTLWGGMWQLTADQSRSDTAYATGYLAAHTDQTYHEIPCGIQVFQCLHQAEGGATLLVDGYRAVERLRQENPKAFQALCRHRVDHEYREVPSEGVDSPGYHTHASGPVIRLHPVTGDVEYLRFNPYDRAPLTSIPPDEQSEWYHAYYLLSQIISEPEGQLWVQLQPGSVLFIDNWRVMHGRTAFTGKRVMCGCYLPRDDWTSGARMRHLL